MNKLRLWWQPQQLRVNSCINVTASCWNSWKLQGDNYLFHDYLHYIAYLGKEVFCTLTTVFFLHLGLFFCTNFEQNAYLSRSL